MKKSYLLLILLFLPVTMLACSASKEKPAESVYTSTGNIKSVITSTGSVAPMNRLQIKPPVAGRIEGILVKEGQNVKKGQILAWLSSSDRAALLDAAREKGPAEVKYWEDVYKPTPIIAPINGSIIVSTFDPGQTVAVGDAILVMSDHLVVKAQVDETDLGRIKLGQLAEIVLDAYPSQKIEASVEHIAYESTVVNNVNVYEVDVYPASVPLFVKSGMSATVNFLQDQKKNVLLLPSRAVLKKGAKAFVFAKVNGKVVPVPVETGLESADQIEMLSGVTSSEEVIVPTQKMTADFIKSLSTMRFRSPFGLGRGR